MNKIHYHVTSEIWLHCEDFHNAGLKSEEIKTIIEKIKDPGSSTFNLRCERSGLNGNWVVKTHSNNPDTIDEIVDIIQMLLTDELFRKKKSK